MRMPCFAAALIGSLLCAAAAPTPPVAVKFLGLFQQLREAELPPAGRRHVSFAVSSTEINAYLRYALSTAPRPGLESVRVKVFPSNYLSTYAVIDFDAIERWKPGTVPTLLRPFLRGKKSVWVDYRFQALNSKATFTVEKAYYNDIRLPAFFVQKMIQIVAARQPEHYDTSKPLPLPFGVRQVWTEDQTVRGEN